MSRFNFEESENYGVGKNNYFGLKDDKDTAVIRFLYNTIDDVEGVAVHEVEVNGNRTDIECLRRYNEPLEKCPFCAAGIKQNAKMYIPVYDQSSKESKIWTRGKSFFQQLSSLCSRYNPLVATPIEVERCGKKGDVNTTYQMYPMQSDNAIIQDFPEIKPEGICFYQKTVEEMNYYLDNGVFPEEVQTRQQQRQNQVSQRNTREVQSAPIRRRPTTYNNEENIF